MTFKGSHFQSRRLGPWGLLALTVAATSGCLDRPIAQTAPQTNNVFVKQNPAGGIDKIDVLFMIDNSLSMGDKQAVMAAAVPQLLGRLTNPDCVDPAIPPQLPTQHLDNPVLPCPEGLQREFAPVKDIHIGVVDSALGDFGGDTCPEATPDNPQNFAQNDHAWLLGALPRNAGVLGAPFLSWTPDDANNYGPQIDAKITEFGNFVAATTELGCGFEMSLEGWYRFLVDPSPPVDVTTVGNAANQRGAVDTNILQQRQAFLRPDSLLAVFMLADENDCSMRDNSYGWIAMTQVGGFRMWRGSSRCAANPNDPCCFSCMLGDVKTGVSQACLDTDTACRQADPSARLAAPVDDVNMRCRAMKKRFGYDFLFPPSRYVNALTKVQICPDQDYGDLDCDCTEAKKKGIPCKPGTAVKNPLYQNLIPSIIPTGPERTGPDAVFLAGVVGVPWQDLAVDPSDGATLEYKKATQLDWGLFAPKVDEDYATATLGDPLMIESSQPRTGTHPITGQPVAAPEANRGANKINGHEWYTSDKDVQFACIFSLDVPLAAGQSSATRFCDLGTECGVDDGSDRFKICSRKFDGCSCTLSTTDPKGPTDPFVTLSPLCQDPQNAPGATQYFAKAYPGLRELQVLRGFFDATSSDNAIVGSICPKDLTADKQSAGYGYNPAVKALVDRLKEKLGGTCLPRKLIVQADGTVPCAVVEAIPQSAKREWCNCQQNQRAVVTSELGSAIKGALQREGICGVGQAPSCDTFCMCKLNELLPSTAPGGGGSPAGDKCLNDLNVEKSTEPPGFCYVAPSQGKGDAQVVAACGGSADQKRIIRIVGNSGNPSNPQLAAPAPGKVFIACSGAAYEAPAAAPAP